MAQLEDGKMVLELTSEEAELVSEVLQGKIDDSGSDRYTQLLAFGVWCRTNKYLNSI